MPIMYRVIKLLAPDSSGQHYAVTFKKEGAALIVTPYNESKPTEDQLWVVETRQTDEKSVIKPKKDNTGELQANPNATFDDVIISKGGGYSFTIQSDGGGGSSISCQDASGVPRLWQVTMAGMNEKVILGPSRPFVAQWNVIEFPGVESK